MTSKKTNNKEEEISGKSELSITGAKDTSSGVKEKKTEAKEAKQTVYIGPSIMKPIQLSKFSVFKGQLPKYVEDFVKENEAANSLFVPVEDLSTVLRDLEDSKSLRARLVANAVKQIKG